MLKNDENKKIEIAKVETQEKNDDVIKFDNTYVFEGKEYSEIDLGDLDRFTAAMMDDAETLYRAITKNPLVQPEYTTGYSLCAASVLTGKPIEFFKGLSAREVMKIKGKIGGFLMGLA
ncbi:MAG: hypothetical protein Q4G33_05955 [bacterium]|nr:hypothetical protein [bacterium]